MAKAKSLITPIRGYRCEVCGAEMIGVNKKQAQDHYNSLIDKPFPKGFTFTHSVFVYRVTGKGTLSQSDTPQFSSWLGAAI